MQRGNLCCEFPAGWEVRGSGLSPVSWLPCVIEALLQWGFVGEESAEMAGKESFKERFERNHASGMAVFPGKVPRVRHSMGQSMKMLTYKSVYLDMA